MEKLIFSLLFAIIGVACTIFLWTVAIGLIGVIIILLLPIIVPIFYYVVLPVVIGYSIFIGARWITNRVFDALGLEKDEKI